MKKVIVLLLAIGSLMASCQKQIKRTLEYNVSNDTYDSTIQDIYIPDSGTYTMPVLVKFLSGFQGDSVKLVISGLPSGIVVSPNSFNGIPTYTENFVFTTNKIAEGVYPVSITAYTSTQVPHTYNFNVNVIPPNCSDLFAGNLNGSNMCTTGYVYSATATSIGYGYLAVSNFGGYGNHAVANVSFNCNSDSLYIYNQNIGNGVYVTGAGTYTADKMVITYTAVNPAGVTDNCVATFTR